MNIRTYSRVEILVDFEAMRIRAKAQLYFIQFSVFYIVAPYHRVNKFTQNKIS